MSTNSEGATVTKLHGRLDDRAGGATVDTSKIDSVRFAAGTKELDAQFRKGSDVRVTVIARVTGTPVDDKYDAHGNVAETIRGHRLRIDEVESIELVRADAAKTAAAAAAEGDPAGGEEPPTEPEPDGDDSQIEQPEQPELDDDEPTGPEPDPDESDPADEPGLSD